MEYSPTEPFVCSGGTGMPARTEPVLRIAANAAAVSVTRRRERIRDLVLLGLFQIREKTPTTDGLGRYRYRQRALRLDAVLGVREELTHVFTATGEVAARELKNCPWICCNTLGV